MLPKYGQHICPLKLVDFPLCTKKTGWTPQPPVPQQLMISVHGWSSGWCSPWYQSCSLTFSPAPDRSGHPLPATHVWVDISGRPASTWWSSNAKQWAGHLQKSCRRKSCPGAIVGGLGTKGTGIVKNVGRFPNNAWQIPREQQTWIGTQ